MTGRFTGRVSVRGENSQFVQCKKIISMESPHKKCLVEVFPLLRGQNFPTKIVIPETSHEENGL